MKTGTKKPELAEKTELAEELAEDIAGGDVFSVRSPWNTSEIVRTLRPARLADLIGEAKAGATADLMTLAEEIEEHDAHYRSVLSTRKLAIVGLDPVVEPAGEDERSQQMAAAVRRDVIGDHFPELIASALDGLGKGYSVTEVLWDVSGVPWKPAAYQWRDPRWFEYDRRTGRRLLLRDGAGLTPLRPYKFIVHEPHLKSGLPIRAGLVTCAAYLHLIKASAVASWAAYMEVYGHPLRIGRFPKNATANDKNVLRRAVANMGRDIGVIVPESMVVDVVDAVKPGSSTGHFEQLVTWVDDQVSKLVLGQTATTEGTPGKLGAQDAQEEVRLDIKEADASQLEATLNRDLVRPYVMLNWGPQERYPALRLPVPRPEDVDSLVENAVKLIDRGMRVKASELYGKLGLTEPEEGDVVLQRPAAGMPAPPNAALPNAALQAALMRALPAALNGQRGAGVRDELDELLEGQEWTPMTANIHAAVAWLAGDATSYEEAKRRLPELLDRLDSDRVTMALADSLLRARGVGDARFRSTE